MAGMYGSFEDIKKAVGVVVILLVVSFFLGYISGKKAAKSEAPTPTSGGNNTLLGDPAQAPTSTPTSKGNPLLEPPGQTLTPTPTPHPKSGIIGD